MTFKDVIKRYHQIQSGQHPLEKDIERMADDAYTYEPGNFRFVAQEVANLVTAKHVLITHKDSHVIWVYNGSFYEPRGEEVIREEVRWTLGENCNEHYVNEVVAQIRETSYTPAEKFVAPIHLINLKNGVLDINTNVLLPHSPENVFINELPVAYNPSAVCPKIMKFLSEVVQADDISTIQEIIGYCLYRGYPISKAVMLYGEGHNGKSTLLKLIINLLGTANIATPALQDLLYDRFSKAQLFGKLANIHADIPEKSLANTGVFKMLTGGDYIYAQEKYSKGFSFYNYAKLLYSANTLPKTNDISLAFWRRWILIEFKNFFPDGAPQTDMNLIKKLTSDEELSGLLNWAIEGLKRLLSQGKFTMSTTREAIETRWISETDSLRAFTSKYFERDNDYLMVKNEFYSVYSQFCEDEDVQSETMQNVGRRLPTILPGVVGDTRYEINGKKEHVWLGLKPKAELVPQIPYNFLYYNRSQKKQYIVKGKGKTVEFVVPDDHRKKTAQEELASGQPIQPNPDDRGGY